MADAFISYSRNDQALAAMRARAAESDGYDASGQAELPPHRSCRDVITKSKGPSPAIVVRPAMAVKSSRARACASLCHCCRSGSAAVAAKSYVDKLELNPIERAKPVLIRQSEARYGQ
jgi:hypothetical protein